MLSFVGAHMVEVLAGAKQPKPCLWFSGSMPGRRRGKKQLKNSVSECVCSEKKMKFYLTLLDSVK